LEAPEEKREGPRSERWTGGGGGHVKEGTARVANPCREKWGNQKEKSRRGTRKEEHPQPKKRGYIRSKEVKTDRGTRRKKRHNRWEKTNTPIGVPTFKTQKHHIKSKGTQQNPPKAEENAKKFKKKRG